VTLSSEPATSEKPLIIACGALATDLRAVFSGPLAPAVEIRYLPANLHYRPERIMGELAPVVEDALATGRQVFIAYADCGTGGLLDAFLAEHPGVRRLPGAHCYEFFAGADEFADMHDDAPGTFYLTDFLAKHFDSLVWVNLGLDRHPELRDAYFGNYTRVVYLAQTDDPLITRRAADAADLLGLAFERRQTGRGGLAEPVAEWLDSIDRVSIKSGGR
jgi:Protein of unknown function (DUF1638)